MINKIFYSFIIFFIFVFSVHSKTTISGGLISTQNDEEGLNVSSDIFYKSYKINPPKKIIIDTKHLDKIIDFNEAVHLERRIGIGNPIDRVHRYIGLSRKQAIDLIISELVNTKDDYIEPNWVKEVIPLNFMENGFRGPLRKCYNSILKQQKQSLKSSWFEQIIGSDIPQFERLVLFWHNHFVVGFDGAYERSRSYGKHLINLRKHAKGNLREFLKEILSDPAMISYLNNDENFIGNVNENLGRELLELFTIGEGNYAENDVKNLSKLLTGHSVNPVSLEYEFVGGAATSKSWIVLGEEIRTIDEIVDLLLNHPKLSDLIGRKIFKEYVSLEQPSQKSLDYIKSEFYYNNFEISYLLKAVLETTEFWKANNRLGLVKSPVDIIFGTVRTLESTGNAGLNDSKLLYAISELGQDLIDPPNVSGWPGGLKWLDGNAIEKRNEILAKTYSESFFDVEQETDLVQRNKEFGSISAKDLCQLATKFTFNNNILERVWRDENDNVEEQKYVVEAKSRKLDCISNQDTHSKFQKKSNKNLIRLSNEYYEKVFNIFNQADPEQLIVETMLIRHFSNDFLINKHPSIHFVLYNVKLGDRHWDGFQFSIGVARKWEGNFIRFESNRCFPECLDSYLTSFSKKQGTRVVKFSYPDGFNKKRYTSLSSRDKLLVNRLYELTSNIINGANIFDVFNKGDEKNKNAWFDWLRERHNNLDIKKISGKSNLPTVILINNDRSELQRMCSSIISKVGKNNLSDSFLENYNAQNSNKIYNKANEFGVNLSKLLISDLNISNAELDIRKLLFNEAYQLK